MYSYVVKDLFNPEDGLSSHVTHWQSRLTLSPVFNSRSNSYLFFHPVQKQKDGKPELRPNMSTYLSTYVLDTYLPTILGRCVHDTRRIPASPQAWARTSTMNNGRLSPIRMETMATMVRILRLQWKGWLTDASFRVDLAAFK